MWTALQSGRAQCVGVRENLGLRVLRTQRSYLLALPEAGPVTLIPEAGPATLGRFLNLPKPPLLEGTGSAWARSPPSPHLPVPPAHSPMRALQSSCTCALSDRNSGELILDYASAPAGSPLLGLWFGLDLPVILHAFALTLLPSL